MSYPDQFLKGIPNNSHIDEYGPTADLFYFLDSHQNTPRDDDFLEESINWHDDEKSKEILFDQRKNDGSLQFSCGIAIMCRNELQRLINKPSLNGQLNYERRAIEGNIYHGNLLLRKTVGKREMKKIAANIALTCYLRIIDNPNTSDKKC